MDTVCAWCNKQIINEGSEITVSQRPVSHGICLECAKRMFAELSESMNEYLNRFDIPILIIDKNENLVSANDKALKRAGIKPEELKGMRCGDVIECSHATELGRCGKTVHCQSCVIRNSVLYTHSTGKSRVRVPAFPDIQQYDPEQKAQILISTEKVGEMVFIKIEGLPEKN